MAENCCGDCRTPQDLVPIPFEIEHILPKAAGGTDDEENLRLSCGVCNSFKHAKTHAIDPQTKEAGFLIRADKSGANILSSAKINPKFQAKLPAGA